MRGSYTSETATISWPGRSLSCRMRPRARPPVPITATRMRSFAPSAEEGATRQPARRPVVAPRETPRNRRRPDGSLVLIWLLLGFRRDGVERLVARAQRVRGLAHRLIEVQEVMPGGVV